MKSRTGAIGLLSLVVAAAVAAHLFNPTDWPPLAIKLLHSLHGPGFSGVAVTVLWYLHSRHACVANYLIAAAITMGIGLISEIAQIPGPRNAQIKDLVIDGIGIVGALGVVASFDKRVRSAIGKPAHILLPVVASVALAFTCVPTAWYSYVLYSQQQAFPVLLSSEHSWELLTISKTGERKPRPVDAPPGWPTAGTAILHGTETGRRGIFLSLHPLPNWQGYSSLSFVVASAGDEFLVSFCIRDMRPHSKARRNRFCKRLPVNATPQRWVIEFEEIQAKMKNRPFDFSRVAAVVFSAARPGRNKELFIDDIRLNL